MSAADRRERKGLGRFVGWLFPNQYAVRSVVYMTLAVFAMVLQLDSALVVGCLILSRIEWAEGRR